MQLFSSYAKVSVSKSSVRQFPLLFDRTSKHPTKKWVWSKEALAGLKK